MDGMVIFLWFIVFFLVLHDMLKPLRNIYIAVQRLDRPEKRCSHSWEVVIHEENVRVRKADLATMSVIERYEPAVYAMAICRTCGSQHPLNVQVFPNSPSPNRKE